MSALSNFGGKSSDFADFELGCAVFEAVDFEAVDFDPLGAFASVGFETGSVDLSRLMLMAVRTTPVRQRVPHAWCLPMEDP